MNLNWAVLMGVLILAVAADARPAHESITYRNHPYPSLGKYFRLPIHPVAQNDTLMEEIHFRYNYFRQMGRHDDLIESGAERHAFQRVMQTPSANGREDYEQFWRDATQCTDPNASAFPTELSAQPEERLAALYGMMQTNCRASRAMKAVDYFREIHKGTQNFQRVFPRTDPSTIERCTMGMDDDGLCGSLTNTDDDDDDQNDPCADDDDGMPYEQPNHPNRFSGSGFTDGRGRCCGPHEKNGRMCKGSNYSFDDEDFDYDDEEANGHYTDYGNEMDDDDADDDDGKQTYSWVDNTQGIDNVADFNRVQQQMRNAHETTTGVVNFVNQVWLCTHNPVVSIPFSLAVRIPVQGFNETAVPGSNITISMLDDDRAVFVYNNTISARPCSPENNTQIYNFTATVDTTVLVTQSLYDNSTMSFVPVQVPMSMPISVPASLQVTASIPDPALYPQVNMASELLNLADFGLVADGDQIAQHIKENWENTHLGLPGGVYDNFPLEGFANKGGQHFQLQGLLPMLDMINFGPYYFSDSSIANSCKTCQRMCQKLEFHQTLQVMRARNATRFFVNPAIHEEREVRLLNSHRSYYGDMLCEMKDMMDWLSCFSRTVQFPQLERVLSCLELQYFGAQNNQHALPFTNIDMLISYGRDYIREIEVWYAERGYYSQGTIDRGCIDPEIVNWAQTCMPDFLRARLLNEQPRYRLDEDGNITHPYEEEFNGMCLFDAETTAYSGKNEYGDVVDFDLVRPLEFRGSKCMPSQGNPRERHIRDCRASAFNQIMKKFKDAMTSVRTLTLSMHTRVGLLAKHLRTAREHFPAEYVFPSANSKCFATENTAFALITPSGNITQALDMLQQSIDLTPLQLLPTP